MKYKLDFNLRPLSPSSMSSFLWDKEKWFRSYLLNEKQTSPEMTFGSWVDKKIQDDQTFIPSLPRYPLMQEQMTVSFSGIKLTGRFDGLDLDKYILIDYKTGKKQQDEKWSLQLKFYLILIYVTKKIPPEKFACFIHWLPTVKKESGDFDDKISFRDNPVVPITVEYHFTMKDITTFGVFITETVKSMHAFVESKK